MRNKVINIQKNNSNVNRNYIFADVSTYSKYFPAKNTILPSDYMSYMATELNSLSIISLELTDVFMRIYNKDYVRSDKYKSYYEINKLIDVNAIKNSLHNIFTWIPGLRILNPEFGSNLRRMLYEGLTDFNIEQIAAEIRSCVSKWEPRVTITEITHIKSIDDIEDNTVHLRIKYSIPDLDNSEKNEYYYDYITTKE